VLEFSLKVCGWIIAFAILVWLWRFSYQTLETRLLPLLWGPAAASSAIVLAAWGFDDNFTASFGRRVQSGAVAVIFLWLVTFVVIFAATLTALVVVHILPRISG
jgi:hypothetical protein